MKTKKQKLGTAGEDMAVELLLNKSFKIIDRNFRQGHNELDIICTDRDDLVIVEVKSVRVSAFGMGEARVSKSKQRSIFKATYAFLNSHTEYSDMNVRFDVIVVNFDCFPAEIIHYEGAFWQSW